MRLKNIKGASDYVNNSNYIIKEPEKLKGMWQKEFNNEQEIHIEIGMGRGDFIINMALKYPNINFIGIEMYDSVIYKAIKKLEKLGDEVPTNLRLIRMDANKIDEVFLHEINRIYLNFSDPWPKAKHAKRRLTSKQFLDKYDIIFAKEHQIFQKTDNNDLFEFSIESLQEAGYKLQNITRDLYSDNIENNVPTEYETKFSKEGIKINRLEAYK